RTVGRARVWPAVVRSGSRFVTVRKHSPSCNGASVPGDVIVPTCRECVVHAGHASSEPLHGGGAMAKRDTASSKGNRPRAGGGQGKPNILVIWGDDIGITNLSCYSSGLMGYHTPNIDRRRATGTATTARPTSSSTTTTITIASPTRTTFASTTSATPAPGTAWDNRGTPDAGRTGRGNRHMPERAPERRIGSPA